METSAKNCEVAESAGKAVIGQKLALGTVQLGLPYGIANVQGKPDLERAEAIIERAWNLGIRWFDTAQAYGDSEVVLGHCLARGGWSEHAKVVSKLSPDADIETGQNIRQAVMDSMKRLRVPALSGFLLHREEMLDAWPGPLSDALLELKQEGLIQSVGVSVYSPERALQALHAPDLDVIQVPANIFDRRMVRAQVFQIAAEKNKRVFVRSVYLQGLALLDAHHLPERIAFARSALAAFTRFCGEQGVSRKQFALAYVRQMAPDSVALFGAETCEQVEENCALAVKSIAAAAAAEWDRLWPEDDEILVNPSKWPR